MGAVRMYARAVLRQRVAGTIAVALLVGIAGTAVLGALAGARRTDSAYPRLLASEHVGDVTVGTQGVGAVPVAAVRRLPHVQWAESVRGFVVASRPEHGPIVFQRDLGAASVYASPAAREGYRSDRGQVLEGRLPDPARVDEGVVNEAFVRGHRLGVGNTYRAYLYRLDDVIPLVERARALGREPTGAELRPTMTPVDFHITGVIRSPSDIVVNENDSNDTIFATPAFARRYASKAFLGAVSVKLQDPVRDTAGFERAVRRQLPKLNLDFGATATNIDTFSRVVGPYGDALRLFALVAALTGLFVVGQALARLVAWDSSELDTLAALGTTRRQRLLSCSFRSIVALCAGSVVAVVAAYGLSPMFPVGRARDAEPASGLRFDPQVLLLGGLLMVLVFLLPVVAAAYARVNRERASGGVMAFTPSRVARRFAQIGAPVSAVTGVRYALQRDRTATGSSLTTLVGLVTAIVTVTAALVFAANLDDLVASPARYGWTWGALVDTYNQEISRDFTKRVRADDDIAGITAGSRASFVVAGRAVPAYGFRHVTGDVSLAFPRGRAPRGEHEIAFGAQTLRDLGRSVGDTVTISTATGASGRLRIVGQVLLPSLTVTGTLGVGQGAAVDAPAMRALDPSASPAFFLVDLAPGASVPRVAARYGSEANVYGTRRPGDVIAYGHVRSTPLLLAALLGVLGAGVLAHLLVTSIRSRRRELAVLKTLGFTRRQLATTVAWLATTLAGLALLVGIPLGLVAGRWTWRSFAADLGIDEVVSVPILALVAVAAVAVALANLIAALPARAAARTRPATVLRSE